MSKSQDSAVLSVPLWKCTIVEGAHSLNDHGQWSTSWVIPDSACATIGLVVWWLEQIWGWSRKCFMLFPMKRWILFAVFSDCLIIWKLSLDSNMSIVFCNSVTEVVSVSWVCIDVLPICISQKSGRFLQKRFFMRVNLQKFWEIQTLQGEQDDCMSFQCSIHMFPVEYLCYRCRWVKTSFYPCLVNTTSFHLFTQGPQYRTRCAAHLGETKIVF